MSRLGLQITGKLTIDLLTKPHGKPTNECPSPKIQKDCMLCETQTMQKEKGANNIINIYPLAMTNTAMENHQVSSENPLFLL